MALTQNLPNRFALILDPDTIENALKRAAGLNLPRRECRPLDRYTGRRVSADLAKYDAEVEAAPMADEEIEAIDAMIDASRAPLRSDIDFDDDEL
jgi:hypothetical protein